MGDPYDALDSAAAGSSIRVVAAQPDSARGPAAVAAPAAAAPAAEAKASPPGASAAGAGDAAAAAAQQSTASSASASAAEAAGVGAGAAGRGPNSPGAPTPSQLPPSVAATAEAAMASAAAAGSKSPAAGGGTAAAGSSSASNSAAAAMAGAAGADAGTAPGTAPGAASKTTTTTTTTTTRTTEAVLSSVVHSTLLDDDIESDLQYTTDKLDEFYAQLRADIQQRLLASQARTRQHYATQLQQLRLLRSQQVTELTRQIDTLKEQLFWSQKKAANFMKPYEKLKQLYSQQKVVESRAHMQRRYFLLWRQNVRYTVPPKALVSTWIDPMARKGRLRAAFVNWRAAAYAKRQSRDTQFWKSKIKEISGTLVDRYEQSLTELRVQLADAHLTIRREKEARLNLQRAMQQAFLRGVSALNMEALSVFHDNGAGAPPKLLVQPPLPIAPAAPGAAGGAGGSAGAAGGIVVGRTGAADDEKRADTVATAGAAAAAAAADDAQRAEQIAAAAAAADRAVVLPTVVTHDAPQPAVVQDDSVHSTAPSPFKTRRAGIPQMTYSVSVEPCATVTQLPPEMLPESVLPSSHTSFATGATLTDGARRHRDHTRGVHTHALQGGDSARPTAPPPTLTMTIAGPNPRHHQSKTPGSALPSHAMAGHGLTRAVANPQATRYVVGGVNAGGKASRKPPAGVHYPPASAYAAPAHPTGAAVPAHLGSATIGSAYGAIGGAVVDVAAARAAAAAAKAGTTAPVGSAGAGAAKRATK